ncbi:hypothetical protein DID76_03990 [Candidatus Marinamargulisbacteria bacterium SCGC AG-414-C22]|nr:hypothetical protein DID76_03990 [Candidatus Marinamargulisbacteria bacterium SCGC AG-414-C22]
MAFRSISMNSPRFCDNRPETSKPCFEPRPIAPVGGNRAIVQEVAKSNQHKTRSVTYQDIMADDRIKNIRRELADEIKKEDDQIAKYKEQIKQVIHRAKKQNKI